MLASIFTLKGDKNYERVRNEGKLFQSKNFGVSIYFRNDDTNSRFGFVVSTKISKNATQRNRIKRALNESVRHNLYILKNGYDVVYLAKPSIESVSTDEIMAENKEFLTGSILSK